MGGYGDHFTGILLMNCLHWRALTDRKSKIVRVGQHGMKFTIWLIA